MLRGEGCENNIARFDLCANAGELTELLWTQVRLNCTLKGSNKLRDLRDGIRTGEFIAQRT
jgi:hypothetical protein